MCVLIYCTYSGDLPASYTECAFLSGALITGVEHQISCKTASYHLQPSLTQYLQQINFKPHGQREAVDVK